MSRTRRWHARRPARPHRCSTGCATSRPAGGPATERRRDRAPGYPGARAGATACRRQAADRRVTKPMQAPRGVAQCPPSVPRSGLSAGLPRGARSVLRRVLPAAAVLAVLGSSAAVAQAAPKASKSGASPRTAAAKGAADLVATRPARLHASAGDAFVQRSVISTPEGLQYVPYVRTHGGLPVVGGDFVVVTRPSGQVVSASVAQRSPIDVSTTPAISAARAERIARAQSPSPERVESTRLVVQAEPTTPRLAYESVVAGHRGAIPSRLHVFVDAATGAVISAEDEVKDGTGTGWINGPTPLSINTSGSGSSFSMTDGTRPGISCR